MIGHYGAPHPETLNTYDFFQRFPDEEAARRHFENHRWRDLSYCGHCGSTEVSACKNQKPMPYRCRTCRKHFSVRTGTVLAASRLPLQKWLLAIYMLTSVSKGIPSTQMARELGITEKSAWFLAKRIRQAWLKDLDDKTSNHLQVNETHVGDCEKNKCSSKKLRAGRSTVGKTAAGGLRDEASEVHAVPVPDSKAGMMSGKHRCVDGWGLSRCISLLLKASEHS